MIIIKNVRTLGGEVINHEIPSSKDYTIEANKKLLLFPGLIDPHICFGSMDSQDWNLAIESAIRGGITTAIEIPNEALPHNTKQDLEQRNKRIAKGLLDLKIPLNYYNYLFYSGSNLEEIDQLGRVKQMIKGIVIHLDDEKREVLDYHWENLFRLAAQEDVPIVINSDNENSKKSPMTKEGETLLEKAISYVEKWSNRLYVLNVATQKEIDLIQEARKRALLVYAETTPQHLFPENLSNANHLWEALNNNVIETIGSGYHVNQQDQDRALYMGGNFSLSDPIFFLPFLLTAVNEKKTSIEKLAHFTSHNIRDILEISRTNDFVLIDLEKEETIQKIHSHHSVNIPLKGWPVYTITQGHVFSSPKGGYHVVRSH
jgi:dihydroorotase